MPEVRLKIAFSDVKSAFLTGWLLGILCYHELPEEVDWELDLLDLKHDGKDPDD
ncbi:hypothetical protein [Geoglobus ahangari]